MKVLVFGTAFNIIMLKLSKKIIAVLLLIGLFSIKLYASFDLSGYLLHDSRVLNSRGIYPDQEDRGEFSKSISRVEFNAARVDEEGFSLFSKIWITYNHLDSYNESSSLNRNSEDLKKTEYKELDLREAYITSNFGPIEFKLGKMTLNWWRTDEINAIDIINPEDLSEFYTIDKKERKIPILLFDTLFYSKYFTFQIAWIPFFEPAKIPSTGPWAQKDLLQLRSALNDKYSELDFNAKNSAGKRNIDNSEVAAHLSGNLGSFDYGYVFFYGYNDIPACKIEVIDLQPDIDIIYRRYHGYGFDFANCIYGYGLRGEIMYRDKILYPLKPSPLVFLEINNSLHSDIQSIFGIDKTFGEDFYINLQVSYNRILDYKDDLITDENVTLGMGTIENKFFDDDLKIGMDFLYGFNEIEWMISPYMEYEITTNLKTKTGVYIIDGPKDGYIGQFKNNDLVFLRINYVF